MTLNYDCIYKIMDYVNDLKHVEKYKKVLEQVSFNAAFTKVKRIKNHYTNQYFTPARISDELGLIDAITFDDLLELNSTVEERKWFIKELSNCKCCERHKQNKPTLTEYLQDGQTGNYPINYDIPIDEYSCRCDCRHISRYICRVDNTNHDPPTASSQSELHNYPDDMLDDNMVGLYEEDIPDPVDVWLDLHEDDFDDE